VSFDTIALPNAGSIAVNTQRSAGLASIYAPARAPKAGKKNKPKESKKPKKPKEPAQGKMTELRALAKQQANAQLNARTRGLLDVVRGPNKREALEDLLLAKLPYHPQWYRTNTRFDTVLNTPLDFGTVNVSRASLDKAGFKPQPDQTALVRLLTPLNSSEAHTGDVVTGVLSQPLFSAKHELLSPAGTRLTGKVTLTRRARMFHRGGQLRFAFDEIQSATFERPAPSQRAQAQMVGAEEETAGVKIDQEGTAKMTESKTRFLRPAIAGLIAAKSMDEDTGKQTASGSASPNYSGRSLGGFSGFGLLGSAVARGPRPIGAVLGFYGLAWSVYTNIVARGREVTFEKNAEIAIRFGAPRPAPR
jgi:hypothetical protein